MHVANAADIFGVAIADVTSEQRTLAKFFGHGSHYGMKGKTMSDTLLDAGFVLSAADCQKRIDTYMVKRPAIPQWQRWVRGEVMQERRLVTGFGRELDFTYTRLDDQTYQRAYAFQPQSEAVDTLNQWGWRPLFEAMARGTIRGSVNAQVHDEVIASVVPDDVGKAVRLLAKGLTRERLVGPYHVPLAIPVEFALGFAWGSRPDWPVVKWRKLPSTGEIEAAVAQLVAWGRANGRGV
jgi:DNA polymerase-1